MLIVLKVMCSEAATPRTIQVLAETGGAVSALTQGSTSYNINKLSRLQAAESLPFLWQQKLPFRLYTLPFYRLIKKHGAIGLLLWMW